MISIAEMVSEINNQFISTEARRNMTVIETLNQFFSSVKIDKALGRRIYQFQIGYVNTSREYVDFFGSNLLGVHVIRFREADVLRFFNEVLEIDYQELEEAIRATDTIEHHRKVSSDIFNLTLMYLIHRCLSEKTLIEKDRHWMAHNAALVFFYRAIAALISAWFKYPADPKVAQATYANLSLKFLIKQLGSWHKVLDYRANELILKTGIYYNRLIKLNNDDDLVKLINGAANQIKDMILNYYGEFVRVHAQGDRIGVTSTTGMNVEGKEVVRDTIRNVDRALAQIKQHLVDPNVFVKEELIRVITDINKNTSPRLVRETLVWLSTQSGGKDHKLIDDFITSVIIYSYHLIQTRFEASQTKDIAYVLVQLKNFYLSTRSTDSDLLHIRDLADQILNKAHKNLSTSLLLSTRTAIVLYVTFRSIVGQRQS